MVGHLSVHCESSRAEVQDKLFIPEVLGTQDKESFKKTKYVTIFEDDINKGSIPKL